MFEYKLGDNYYTAEQVQQAAQQSNMSLEDYIKKSGLQTTTPQIQPLPEETEELKKAKETKSIGLEKFQVTPEEEEELKANYQASADALFIPEKDFPVKIVGERYNTGQVITRVQPPKGYDKYYQQYLDRAKKNLGEEATQADIFEQAKKLYVRDNVKAEVSRRVEEALKYDEVNAIEKPEVLSFSMQGFRPYPTTPTTSSRQQSESDKFAEEQIQAAKTVREAARKDLDIISNNLEVYKKAIESIDDKQRQILSNTYFNKQEVDQANETVRRLADQKEALIDNYVKAYDNLIDQAEALEDEELLIDVLKRSYAPGANILANATATLSGLASGALSLPQWLADVTTVNGFGDGKMTLAGGELTKAFAKYVTNPAAEGLKKIEENIRSSIEKPITVDEIKTLRDVGAWGADLIGNQLPIMAALYAFPNAGLLALSASAGGTKYQEMIQDQYTNNKDYNNLELFLGPAIVALGEYGSEWVTASQLGRVKGLISKNDNVLEAAKDYVANVIKRRGALSFIGDTLAEGGSESIAQLAENFVDITILDKQKSIWEGVDNAFASGAFMSSMVYKAPLLGAKMIAPFMDKTTKAKLRGNIAMIDMIVQETIKPIREELTAEEIAEKGLTEQDIKENYINRSTKKQLEEQLSQIIENNRMLMAKTFEELEKYSIDEYGAEKRQEIIDAEIAYRQANSKISELMLDDTIDPDLKDSLVEDLWNQMQASQQTIEDIRKQEDNRLNRALNNPYQDLSDQEISERQDKDLEKAKGIVKQLGLQERIIINSVNNQAQLVEEMEKLGISQELIERARVARNIGKSIPIYDAQGKYVKTYIFINKQYAKEGKRVDPTRHELLHALLRMSFDVKDAAGVEAGAKLFEFVKTFITKDKKLSKTYFGNRFLEYYELYQKGLYPMEALMEEVFPMLSDAIARKDIQYNPTFLNKIGDFTRQSLQRVGMSNISFENASDVFKFILDYNANYEKSSFGEAFKEFAHNGISGRIKFTPGNVEKAFDDVEGQQSLNEQIDNLAGPKNEAGDYTITNKEWMNKYMGKAYEALVMGNKIDGLIAKGFVGHVYGQPIANFIHDIKYNAPGGTSLTEILLKFKPEENNSLIGFINSQLKFARLKVAEQYRIELANKTNMTPELERSLAFKMEEGDSAPVQNEVSRQKKLIDVSNLIPGAEQEFLSKIGELDLIGMYFKSVPNLLSESLAKLLNVKENKILNPQDNLSTQELSNIQDFVFKNIDTIIKVMPLAYVKEAASIEFMDKSTGVPSSLLNLMYEKVDGKWEKKQDIDKDQVLAGFGINPDGSKVENVSPRGTEGQRAKAVVSMLGRLATNIKLRQHAKERNLSQQQILDIQAGKAPAMYDLGEQRSRRAMDYEHQAIVDTLFLLESEIDGLYTGKTRQISEEEGVKLLIKQGLNEGQAKDLHRALNNYEPLENVQRLKDGGFVKSFLSSINYIHYNHERSIKEQLDLVGVDIVDSMGGYVEYRNAVVGSFISPLFDPKYASSLTPSEGINMMRFLYHHFFRPVKETYEVNGRKLNLDKKTLPALFQTKQEFVDFFNEKAIAQFSPIHKFIAKINLDGNIEILVKEHLAENKADKEYSTTLSEKEKRYDPRVGNLYYVDDFHNGNKTEDEVVNGHKYSRERALSDLKKFFVALDNVKSDNIDLGLYKNQDAFDKKALAGLLINMLYNNSGAINHIYEVRGAIKNENAPKKIDRSTVSLYYKFKKDVPTTSFARLAALYLLDKDFKLANFLGTMGTYTGVFVPSSEIKMQPTPEELNKIEQEKANKLNADRELNESRFSGKVDALTEQEKAEQDRLNNIEDRVSLSLSSIGPKKKVKDDDGNVKEISVIPLGNQEEYTQGQAEYDYVEYSSKNLAQKAASLAGIELKNYYINPEIADYDALVQAFFRKGKEGDEDREFFFEALKRPYVEANLKLEALEAETQKKYKRIKFNNIATFEQLDKPSGVFKLSNEDLVKVFLYNKAEHTIPGLTQNEVDFAISKLKQNKPLFKLAKDLLSLHPDKTAVWSKPGSYWKNRTISQEISNAVRTEGRAIVFADWVKVKNAAFSKNNMNKIRALYGKKYHDALADMLDRMETGRSRKMNLSSFEEMMIDWMRGSISNVMFWNMRSATLQLISTLNYIDIENNNPLEAGKSIADIEQFKEDVFFLWNSPYVKNRRKGGSMDISQAEYGELLAEIEDKKLQQQLREQLKDFDKSPGQAIIGFYRTLLNNGFKLTQLGDSVAVSVGGALYLGTMRRKYNELFDSLPLTYDPRSEESLENPINNKKILEELYDKVYVDTNTGKQYPDVNGKIINDKGYAVSPSLFFKNKKFKTNYIKKDKQQNESLFNQTAQDLAYIDFYEKTEESQQSARPDRLSKEQTGILGRLMLGFQNTPLQYNRIILKAVNDIQKGRGNSYKNMARIAYYGVLQNMLFSTLQNGLLAQAYTAITDDRDEEDQEFLDKITDKYYNALNGSAQTLLRGLGIRGSIAYTLALGIFNYTKIKSPDASYYDIARAQTDALAFSPGLNIKMRIAKRIFDQGFFSSKQDRAIQKEMWKNVVRAEDVRAKIRYGLYNPDLDHYTDMATFLFNSPANRMLKKARNISEGLRKQENLLYNSALMMGWDNWSLGIEYKELEKQKQRYKASKRNKTQRTKF